MSACDDGCNHHQTTKPLSPEARSAIAWFEDLQEQIVKDPEAAKSAVSGLIKMIKRTGELKL
jgi:hypothetical protein